MTEQEAIHVADVSEGIGGDATAEPGSPVELPVVDVLTGRSFITGKADPARATRRPSSSRTSSITASP